MPALTLTKAPYGGSCIQDMPVSPVAADNPAQLENQVQLHRGRHSVVWAGYSTAMKQPVVLKVYEKDKMKNRHILNAYREISILNQYVQDGHPGVVSLVAHWEDDSSINLIFEQCLGGDLFQLLLKHGTKLPEGYVCCQVVVPLLTTLQHLHAHSIVHRDIKPENLFLTATGELKLGDFGLAVCLAHERAVARVGTLDYMAPEVLSMPTPEEVTAREAFGGVRIAGYGCKVDIWALGVLIFELLSGKPPYEVEDTAATTLLVQAGMQATFPEEVTQQCRDFVCQAMQRDPEERPSAGQLLKHPWVQAQQQQQEALSCYSPRMIDAMGSGDWLLKAAYLQSLNSNPHKSLSLDTTPPTSPGRRESNSSNQGGGSACSSPRLVAWKQPQCDSPLKKSSSLPPCKSRFSRSNSISCHSDR